MRIKDRLIQAGRPSKLNMTFAWLGVIALVAAPWTTSAAWYWWVGAYVAHLVYFALGVSVGPHRYWSHRSFKTNRFWEHAFLLATTVGSTVSVFGSPLTHRLHHIHTDTEQDPHSPIFKGWRLLNFYSFEGASEGLTRIRHMMKPHIFIYHNYKNWILGGWAIACYLIDPYVFLFLWLIPHGTVYLAHFCEVYFQHLVGYRNHDAGGDSRNVWWLFPLVLDECWHNNHHAHPLDARGNLRWWEISPMYTFIRWIRTDGKPEV